MTLYASRCDQRNLLSPGADSESKKKGGGRGPQFWKGVGGKRHLNVHFGFFSHKPFVKFSRKEGGGGSPPVPLLNPRMIAVGDTLANCTNCCDQRIKYPSVSRLKVSGRKGGQLVASHVNSYFDIKSSVFSVLVAVRT